MYLVLLFTCSPVSLLVATEASAFSFMNLWHACSNWYAGSRPWHVAFTAVPIVLLLLHNQCLHTVNDVCVCVCIYTHPDCVEIVYVLPLVPNDTVGHVA